MLVFFEVVLIVVVVLLLLPCLVLAVQVAAALLLPKSLMPARTTDVPAKVCILMPAHNEASGLEKTLSSLLPYLNTHIRLLIVADNCSDSTADLARAIASNRYPIEVVERHHAHLRGKGYALDFGVRHLEGDPPDVVLILDADCQLAEGAIDILVDQCVELQRPVQALYLMRNLPGASTKSNLAEFAWVVKNFVRPLGFHHLGLPCQLMGTGMAFTWAHISQAKLNTGHIVEDMQLGLDLARKGVAPVFCPEALVTSYFPLSNEGIQAQRTRWEHGHMGIIVGEVPSLLMTSLRRRSLPLFALALDLCIPPLALLVLLLIAECTVTAGLWWTFSVGLGALQIASATMVVLGLTIVVAWLQFGRQIIGLKQLCGVPLYVLAKIPLYALFLIKRQASWVRSKRDGEP